MTLTPSTIRVDLKCGKGAISKGEKCHKGPATTVTKAALAVVGVGGAVGVGLFAKRAWDARAAARLRDAQRNGTRFTPADTPAHATFLSSGNNGRVYVSRDRKTIYKVVTNQRAMKSFAAELTAQERARRLGVRTPKVMAADPVKGLLEMEFLDGFVPIGQATKSGLPAAQKSALRDSLISNMSKLHRAGWGHGDFHYQNVLFKGNETALIDWGNSSQNMVRIREDILRTLQLSKALSTPADRVLVSRAGDKFMNLSDPKQKDVDRFYDELKSLLSPRRTDALGRMTRARLPQLPPSP